MINVVWANIEIYKDPDKLGANKYYVSRRSHSLCHVGGGGRRGHIYLCSLEDTKINEQPPSETILKICLS